MRHLAEQTRPVQLALGRRSQQHTVESADVAVLQNFQFKALQLIKGSLVRRCSEDPRALIRTHLRRHGGERKDALDAKLLCVVDQLATKRILTDRGLSLAEKNDEVMFLGRVVPQKEAVPGPVARLNDPLLDL